MNARDVCNRKARYATKSQAKDVMRRRQQQERAKLFTYECSWCGGWHLTRQPQDSFRASQRRGGAQ